MEYNVVSSSSFPIFSYDSRNKQGSLQVNNNLRQNKTSLGKMVGIGLYNDWYVGGLPPGKRIGGNDGGQATPTFVGCIKDIELNGDQIGFTGKYCNSCSCKSH